MGMTMTPADIEQYLKTYQPQKYKELKASGQLKEYVSQKWKDAAYRLQEITDELLEKDPYPENADLLERVQHRAGLEAIARELLNEEVFVR